MALPGFNKIWQENEEKINCESNSSEAFRPSFKSSNLKRKSGTFFGPRDGFHGDYLPDDSFDDRSSKYSCCNQTFSNSEQLSRHKGEHVKCSFLDCDFSAHGGLVEFHETHQHRNNLYSKISQTDLEKWRQDRKKNFPTANKINKEKEIHEAKVARGEIIEQKSFGKFGKHNNDRRNQSMQRTNFNNCGRNNREDNRNKPQYRNTGGVQYNNWRAKRLKRTIGLAYEHPKEDPLSCFLLNSGNAFNTSANVIAENIDEEDVVKDESAGDDKSIKPSALSLLAAYDEASSEPDEEPPKENPTILGSLNSSAQLLPTQDMSTASDKNPPEISNESTNKDVLHKELMNIPSNNKYGKLPLHPVVRLQKRRQTYLNDFRMYLKRPRLLEMLLAGEIRHERNVVMQCVRYVCDNDFFGVANRPIENSTTAECSGKDKLLHYDNEDDTWDDAL